MRKITSILLAFVLALTLIPAAWAEGEKTATALPEAVNDVITLNSDVTLSSWSQINTSLTLDLKGYTLTVTCQPKVGNNGVLTIKDSGTDGKIILTGTGSGIQLNEGKLILNGGTIHKDAGGNVFLMGAAQFEMNGGSLTANNGACIDAVYVPNNTKVTINGGTIETKATNTCAVYAAEKFGSGAVNVTITGGTVKSAGEYSVIVKGSNVKLTISGGEFVGAVGVENDNNKISIADPSAYLAAGYTAVNADGKWTVKKTTESESAAEVTATTETKDNTTTTTITTITANKDAAASTTNTIDVGSNVVLNDTVKTAEVKVSEDVLKTVVTESATAPVEFKVAENASVTFNKEAVKSIATKAAFTGTISLIVTPDATVSGKEETAKKSVTTDANAKVVELKLVGSGNANLFEAAAGAKATVTVPFTMPAGNNTVKVYYLNAENGNAEYVGTATMGSGTATFTVSHFSNYVLVPTTVTTYHYYNAGTSTTTGNTTSSPKTFDAGVGIYAVSAVLSVTGMAYVGKKKF